MFDWLGNPLSVGCWVVYTSKSKYVGMVLAKLVEIDEKIIKIKPIAYSGRGSTGTKVVVLYRGDGAFSAVTRYYGPIDLPELGIRETDG